MVSDAVKVTGTSRGMKEEDLVKKLKEALKAYIEEQLDAKTIEVRETGKKDLSLSNLEKIADNPLAAIIASYLSLVHQERQDRTNTKIQQYILLVAIISAFSAISSVVVAYFKH